MTLPRASSATRSMTLPRASSATRSMTLPRASSATRSMTLSTASSATRSMTLPRASSATRSMTLPRASSATSSMTLPRASSATRSMTLSRASSATSSMTLPRASSATRSMTLPRASSATRGPEETQGARGERGALVNMELLGLPNIGNTCFLNATLQCLLVLPSFSKAILHQEQLWSSSPFSNLLRCLSDVHRLSLPDSGANQTSKADLMWKVKYSLSGYDLKYLGDTQQDAHELLVNMLCQLKEEGMILKTLGVNYTCPVSQLEFQLVSVRTCTSVLVLHLKRFGGPGGLERLEAPLLFPSELRLSTLCGDMVPHLHSNSPQALTNQAPSIQGSIPQTLASQVSSPPGEAKDSALCCSEAAASAVSEWLLPADWGSLSFGRLRKLRALH
ncbi:ubiquitin carboxyl-terminal hydrolase 37-like isoform X2 [Salvelinus alpinus]|uniref:ubiquitin carboxyl-terminal hydrolase 37-like isoform X2 n=1 Tax=Salvelinus alpinus TaxID=8036 RepID=UPI0039FC8887